MDQPVPEDGDTEPCRFVEGDRVDHRLDNCRRNGRVMGITPEGQVDVWFASNGERGIWSPKGLTKVWDG